MTDEEGFDAQTVHPVDRQPEPRCPTHARGRCECEDDGSAALEVEGPVKS